MDVPKTVATHPPSHTESTRSSIPTPPNYDFYAHQQQMSAVLLGWGIGSMVTGALWWWRQGHSVHRAMGMQFLVWGAVDAALAGFGLRNAAKESRDYQAGHLTDSEVDKKARFLRRVLWFNYGLDNLYIIWGGCWMNSDKPERRGAGIGILLQGVFLWVFDFIYAQGVRRLA